jgi:hypothetical protein
MSSSGSIAHLGPSAEADRARLNSRSLGDGAPGTARDGALMEGRFGRLLAAQARSAERPSPLACASPIDAIPGSTERLARALAITPRLSFPVVWRGGDDRAGIASHVGCGVRVRPARAPPALGCSPGSEDRARRQRAGSVMDGRPKRATPAGSGMLSPEQQARRRKGLALPGGGDIPLRFPLTKFLFCSTIGWEGCARKPWMTRRGSPLRARVCDRFWRLSL